MTTITRLALHFHIWCMKHAINKRPSSLHLSGERGMNVEDMSMCVCVCVCASVCVSTAPGVCVCPLLQVCVSVCVCVCVCVCVSVRLHVTDERQKHLLQRVSVTRVIWSFINQHIIYHNKNYILSSWRLTSNDTLIQKHIIWVFSGSRVRVRPLSLDVLSCHTTILFNKGGE